MSQQSDISTDNEVIDLSIVIRCRNEAASLREVLAAVQAQRTSHRTEVIVVDNASDDDSRAVAVAAGARVVDVARDAFSYGGALNQGFAAARGRLVLTLSAHAVPLGARFVDAVVAPFADNPRLAAARCLGTSARDQLRTWYRPRIIAFTDRATQREFESGEEWLRTYPAATCAVYRRAAWQEQPFDEELEANEDKLWASAVLARGWQLLACCDAMFVYVRNMTWRETLHRERKQHLSLFRLGRRPALTLSQFLLAVPGAVATGLCKGAEEVQAGVLRQLHLYRLPRAARQAPRRGSHSEFEKRP